MELKCCLPQNPTFRSDPGARERQDQTDQNFAILKNTNLVIDRMRTPWRTRDVQAVLSQQGPPFLTYPKLIGRGVVVFQPSGSAARDWPVNLPAVSQCRSGRNHTTHTSALRALVRVCVCGVGVAEGGRGELSSGAQDTRGEVAGSPRDCESDGSSTQGERVLRGHVSTCYGRCQRDRVWAPLRHRPKRPPCPPCAPPTQIARRTLAFHHPIVAMACFSPFRLPAPIITPSNTNPPLVVSPSLLLLDPLVPRCLTRNVDD